MQGWKRINSMSHSKTDSPAPVWRSLLYFATAVHQGISLSLQTVNGALGKSQFQPPVLLNLSSFLPWEQSGRRKHCVTQIRLFRFSFLFLYTNSSWHTEAERCTDRSHCSSAVMLKNLTVNLFSHSMSNQHILSSVTWIWFTHSREATSVISKKKSTESQGWEAIVSIRTEPSGLLFPSVVIKKLNKTISHCIPWANVPQ